ncbi:MAG: DUF885 family protein [Bdellovibrionales bacterium]|nr:DUF885 family protein [Bdellovibrionales bacterium]
MKLSLLLPVLFCLSACSSSGIRNRILEPRVAELNSILDEYFEETLKLDPLFATSIGDHRYDSELPISILPEHRKKEELLAESGLKKIRNLGCRDLPEKELLSCMTFEEELQNQLNLLKADLHDLAPFNQFRSFPIDFAELASGSSYVTFDSTRDYENFMLRLKQVSPYLKAMQERMRLGMERGITVPKSLAQKALKNLKSLLALGPDENAFFKPLRKFPPAIPKSEQIAIQGRYEGILRKDVLPAYQDFVKFVEQEYLAACRKSSGISALPGGRANYLALVRSHTTTPLTPNEIMMIGLREVSRIKEEFEAIKKELGFKGSLGDFYKSVRTNPALFPFRSHESVMEAYERIHQTLAPAIPAHFRMLPKARFEIREVEKFKAETSGEAYQNPSADGSRPGIFWVPIPDPSKYAKKSMEALFLHEAIPGHHFQISLQQELDLPRYRRFTGNNAYVEGWGLYAESLGKDLGLYQDHYSRVGRLEYEMHRAIRLVVDTGIHWKGWSRERAIRYSMEHEPMDEEGIVSEVERYMAIPGQALSYKLGELKIQELKSLAKNELGPNYSDADFHDEILKDGALPLSVLDSKIRTWIVRRK